MNETTRSPWYTQWFYWLLIFFLLACTLGLQLQSIKDWLDPPLTPTPFPATNTPQPTATPTATFVIIPTQTTIPLPTNTRLPTATTISVPENTRLPTITKMPSPTLTHSPTPLPTSSGTTVQPEQTPIPGPQYYYVQPGDSLWKIAEMFYGVGWGWPLIYEANRKIISDPHWIYIDQRLMIP